MGATWYTSDLHFGHRLVAGLRGFGDDTAAHDAAIADGWLRSVRPDDTVWVLGDLTVNAKVRDYALRVIRSLPGTKHLIAGNHDDVSPIHRNAWKRLPEYLTAFASVQAYAKVRMLGEDVLLSHYPYRGHGAARHDDKYEQWMFPDDGKWLIHGHTHIADQRVHGRQFHVGVDAWDLAPVHQKHIEQAIKEAS